MRHVYRCPLRWADLDLLGHVNNVTYVDYLQEARVDLFRTHAPDTRAADLAEGAVVVRHEVTYVSSLTFRLEPVSIECWVSEIRAASFTVDSEIFDEDEHGVRTVYLRARTVLTPYVFSEERPRRLRADEVAVLETLLEPGEPVAPLQLGEPVEVEGGHYPVHVRFSDVDVYGHVNNVMPFEYLQEGRIVLMTSMAPGAAAAQGLHLVVAHTAVDYLRPILLRPEPYDCQTWVSRVGRTSVLFDSVISDGDEVLVRGRVVGVVIDSATGVPTEVPAAYRDLVGGA
ncbi:MAG: acyl-CoA thioesterase [Nocardioides sp.]|nr:acyl-CoA thioesterase [Nocardioides sp.]